MTIQRLVPAQWDAIAELIHVSLKTWYQTRLNMDRFGDDWTAFRLFTDIYETLDPNCCVVAVDDDGKLLGSAFFHPRETHIGVGVVTTHPAAGGRGIARAVLEEIIRIADGKPLRLVSSAMNLESFSLYTKLGFVPHTTFQDVFMHVPVAGLPGSSHRVRSATEVDISRIADFEFELQGIRREHDYRFFYANADENWRLAVLEDDAGNLTGFLAACTHPHSRILGPGVFANEAIGAELIHWMLDHHFRDTDVLWLLPVNRPVLVRQAYGWGARNIETHLASVLGDCPPMRGISLPTFMPESG